MQTPQGLYDGLYVIISFIFDRREVIENILFQRISNAVNITRNYYNDLHDVYIFGKYIKNYII